MAYFDKLWMFRRDEGDMTVFVNLQPSGEVQLKVKIPKSLKDALVGIAQTAADAHEAQMRAEIIGDKHATRDSDNANG